MHAKPHAGDCCTPGSMYAGPHSSCLCSSGSFPSLSLFLHIPSFESSFHFLPSISLMGSSSLPPLRLPLTAYLTLSRPRNCCVHGLILRGWLSSNTLIAGRVPRTGEMKQLLNRLPCKHSGLGSKPRTRVKKPGTLMSVCNPRTREAEICRFTS